MYNVIDSYNRFQSGDKNALCDIIREYSDKLVCFVYCIVNDYSAAEDIAADSFAALMYKPRKFADYKAFKAYLYKVARNKSIDYIRKAKKSVRADDLENILCGDAERDIFEREEKRNLYVCMQKLPAYYKDVLCLSYFDGFSVDEICAITKKNKKQIYNALARAKAALKDLLNEVNNYEDL